jgi:prefoldin subunit 5
MAVDPRIKIVESLIDSDVPEKVQGIPNAKFIDDVEGFIASNTAEDVLKCLHELHGKYQYMQQQYLGTKSSTKQKLPDIQSAHAAVKHIQHQRAANEVVSAQFLLSDNVYVDAEIPPESSDRVALWLGASVMMEYSLEEAEALLSKNDKSAKDALKNHDEALMLLRDQLTTTEVNIARVHNYNVKKRAEARAKETATADPYAGVAEEIN